MRSSKWSTLVSANFTLPHIFQYCQVLKVGCFEDFSFGKCLNSDHSIHLVMVESPNSSRLRSNEKVVWWLGRSVVKLKVEE